MFRFEESVTVFFQSAYRFCYVRFLLQIFLASQIFHSDFLRASDFFRFRFRMNFRFQKWIRFFLTQISGGSDFLQIFNSTQIFFFRFFPPNSDFNFRVQIFLSHCSDFPKLWTSQETGCGGQTQCQNFYSIQSLLQKISVCKGLGFPYILYFDCQMWKVKIYIGNFEKIKTEKIK